MATESNATFFAISGTFRGAFRGSERVPNHAFSCVFRDFRILSNLGLFLSFFRKKCENHAFSHVFDAAGPRFRACSFVVFRVLALRKLAENLPFYSVFGVSVIEPSFLCFSYTLLLAFLSFLRNVAKTMRFHWFFEI